MTSTKKSTPRNSVNKNGKGGNKRTLYSDDSEPETPPSKARKVNLHDYSDNEEDEVEFVAEKRRKAQDNTIWHRAYAFISRYTSVPSGAYIMQCLRRAFSYLPHFSGSSTVDDRTPSSDNRPVNNMPKDTWNRNSLSQLPLHPETPAPHPPLNNGAPRTNNVKANPYKPPAEDSSLASMAENCSIKSSKGGSNSFFSVQDSIRLKEKEQYKQLIQQYTKESLALKPQKTVIGPSNKDAKVQVDGLESSVNSSVDHLRRLSCSSSSKEVKSSSNNLSIERLTTPESFLLRERLRKNAAPTSKPHNASYLTAPTSQAKKPVIFNGLSSTSKLASSQFFSNNWLNDLKSSLHSGKEERQHLIATYENLLKEHQQKREAKLELLDKRLKERTAKRLQAVLKETEEEEEEPYFPEITPEMELKIEEALCNTKPDQILAEGFRLSISRKDMDTLTGLNWLNDEIINFYMNLLMERCQQVKGLPRVYAFNTFFYPKLVTGGHATLARWTRKLDIFAFDLILVPVHMGMHWCLAVIDLRNQKLQYFDSLGGKNMECLNALVEYLKDERKDKKKEDFDMTGWTLEFVKNIPLQMNGSDCGMFALKYAEYITRDAKINFTQAHMPYFRRRMIYEIMTQKLL